MALGTHESDGALSAQLRKDRASAIQMAVLAERERCAKIAESDIPLNEDDGDFLKCAAHSCRRIAFKIRKEINGN